MEFGHIEDQYDALLVDHTLQADGKLTKEVLNKTGNKDCKFYLGLSRWGRKQWCGSLYPEKTKEKDFLEHYGKHFNSIELNATGYTIPAESTVKSWRENVIKGGNPDMLFLPKVSRNITHLKRLRDVRSDVDVFLKSISHFGDNLGPIFFQVGANVGINSIDDFETLFKELPREYEYAVEVRNQEWFTNKEAHDRLFGLMRDHGIISVISDTSGERANVHMDLTKPELFLRFIGNGGILWNSDYERIDAWVDRIEQWIDKGLQKVYFFVHQYDENFSPVLASYAVDKLNERFNAGLTPLNLKLTD